MKCAYCGSRSKDDNYGNCSACGAPREQMKQIEFQPSMIEYNFNSAKIDAEVMKKMKQVMLQDFDNLIKGIKFLGEI